MPIQILYLQYGVHLVTSLVGVSLGGKITDHIVKVVELGASGSQSFSKLRKFVLVARHSNDGSSFRKEFVNDARANMTSSTENNNDFISSSHDVNVM
jgi:hypothetical protein